MWSAEPYSREGIFEALHRPTSFSKHLLTIYSMAVGLGAKRMIDIGIGTTTKALRMAAIETGGVLYGCDNNPNYARFLKEQDEHWEFHLCTSDEFLRQLEGPIGFAVHDGSHAYRVVKNDLELLLPMMRTFGIIAVHDVHWSQNQGAIMTAIKEATEGWPTSMTILTYCAGLAIIRIEEGNFPMGDIQHSKVRGDTIPFACPLEFAV